jgi:hypothetical protein
MRKGIGLQEGSGIVCRRGTWDPLEAAALGLRP